MIIQRLQVLYRFKLDYLVCSTFFVISHLITLQILKLIMYLRKNQ